MHFTHHNTVQPLPQIKAKLTKLITACGKMRRIVNKIESTCTIIYQLFWRSFYTYIQGKKHTKIRWVLRISVEFPLTTIFRNKHIVHMFHTDITFIWLISICRWFKVLRVWWRRFMFLFGIGGIRVFEYFDQENVLETQRVFRFDHFWWIEFRVRFNQNDRMIEHCYFSPKWVINGLWCEEFVVLMLEEHLVDSISVCVFKATALRNFAEKVFNAYANKANAYMLENVNKH